MRQPMNESMETQASHDDNISDHEESDSEGSPENSSEEEIDPWSRLTEDAASKVRAQFASACHGIKEYLMSLEVKLYVSVLLYIYLNCKFLICSYYLHP